MNFFLKGFFFFEGLISFFVSQPVKKKSKLGSTPSVWDAEYRNIVNLLQDGTRQLQEMREKNLPLPEWAVTDIEMITSQLNALL